MDTSPCPTESATTVSEPDHATLSTFTAMDHSYCNPHEDHIQNQETDLSEEGSRNSLALGVND
jgi:hypothetical protein